VPDDENEKKKKDEKKIRDALKAKAVEVHPKNRIAEIRKAIEKKKKKKDKG